MRVLRPVVTSTTSDVFAVHTEIFQCSRIGWKLVSHHLVRRITLLLQQFAHQFERGLPISAGLNQNIENLTFPVHCPLQIHPLAVDGNKQFVQVPTPVWSGTKLSQLAGVAQTELQRPPPNRFIRNFYPTLSEEIFDISKTQREPEIQPNGMLNDFWWETMAAIGDSANQRLMARCNFIAEFQ